MKGGSLGVCAVETCRGARLLEKAWPTSAAGRAGLGGSFVPVPRAPAVMRDRQYRNVAREPDEYNVVRKIVDRKSPHVRVRYTRNERSRLRELLEVLERLANLSDESPGHFTAPGSIPRGGIAQFAACPFAEPNGFQRDNTSRWISSRTVRQSSSSSGFKRASAARRSISRAHADSTSASASSRLASNCAASSARSLAASVRACSNNF